MSIRQNIIALRAKYNLTQLELAKIAGNTRWIRRNHDAFSAH